MATEPTIDLEALLAPIPGDDPAGRSVLFEGPHDEIKQARLADEGGSQGDWQRKQKTADWSSVVRIASDTLATKSKDLQIAAWLTEALVNRSGFAGLRDGLKLMRELQDRFWEGYHPRIEDGDSGYRVAVLAWLNEKLPVTIRGVPITTSGDDGGYSWFRYDEAQRVENLARQAPEKVAAALEEGKISGEQWTGAVVATSFPFYANALADLRASLEEVDRLQNVVMDRFGADATSIGEVRTAVEDILHVVEPIYEQKRPAATADGGEAEVGAAGGTAAVGGPLGQIRSRADALRHLQSVVEFFRRTEPHSPVAYLVQRAIRWAEMPLEDWLFDVMGDDAALARLKDTLGIKAPG